MGTDAKPSGLVQGTLRVEPRFSLASKAETHRREVH